MIKVAVLSLDYGNLPEVVMDERFLASRHVSVFLLSSSAFGASVKWRLIMSNFQKRDSETLKNDFKSNINDFH